MDNLFPQSWINEMKISITRKSKKKQAFQSKSFGHVSRENEFYGLKHCYAY